MSVSGLWTVVQADHDLVWDLINRLTGGPSYPEGTPLENRRTATELVAVESTHEAAEELVIWPVVRERCRDGDRLVFEALKQERQAKRILNELNRISAGTPEFWESVHSVAAHAREHITFEQNQIWPRLAESLSTGESEQLAGRWLAARRTGPTRPHPHTPPLPKVLGTTGTLIARADRLRDALTGRKPPMPRA